VKKKKGDVAEREETASLSLPQGVKGGGPPVGEVCELSRGKKRILDRLCRKERE